MLEGTRVGAFVVERSLGRGGMAEVFAARHARSGTPVALKIAGREREAVLEREARILAALDHPGIVRVLASGRITEDDAQRPYLVLGLEEGGSLSLAGAPVSWDALRALLGDVLAALAHAHARAILHCDIKPGNLLLSAKGRWVLADFGVAVAGEEEDGATKGAGTPNFMAPEQRLAGSRDIGPWSDLYSLGVVAWRALCGMHPLSDTARAAPPSPASATAAGASTGRWAAFSPRVPVPDGAAAWIGRCIAPRPGDRFPSAADALAGLEVLGPCPGTARAAERTAPVAVLVDSWSSISESSTESAARLASPGVAQPDPYEIARRHEAVAPGFVAASMARQPASFDAVELEEAGGEQERTRPRWTDAGLELFGLRSVPLVGRVRERAALWDGYTAAIARQRPTLMVVSGPSGAGKSAVAGWLGRVAARHGAVVWRAVHAQEPGAGDGLAGMVARHLRLRGLEATEAWVRVRTLLAGVGGRADDARLLAEIAKGRVDTGPGERFGALGRTLERLAERQPLVLWIDDAQWALEALCFVRHLLDRQASRFPVAVVLTVMDEAAAARPRERAILAELSKRPEATSVALEKLSQADGAAQVEAMLPVAPEDAARIAHLAGGLPLLTLHLLTDLLQSGGLRPAEDGERLVLAGPLPADVEALWMRRVESVLADRSQADRTATEIAAILGTEVDTAEWERACQEAGVAPSRGLVAALVRHRLARCEADGWESAWAFVHERLRSRLIASAEGAGRLASHHAAVARALGSPRDAEVLLRIGRHRARAGEWEGALAALWRGVSAVRATNDIVRAAALLAELEDTLRAARIAEDDPWWTSVCLEQAGIARVGGDLVRAEELCARAEARARAHVAQAPARTAGDEDGGGRAQALLLRACVERAALSLIGGKPEEARRALDEAMPFEARCLERELVARAWILRGEVASSGLRLKEALASLTRARAEYERVGDVRGMVRIDGLSVHEVVALDDVGQARRLAERAIALAEGSGSTFTQGIGSYAAGLVALAEGDAPGAEAGMRAYIESMQLAGYFGAVLGEACLWLSLVLQGRAAEALAPIAELCTRTRRTRPSSVAFLRSIEAACLASLGRDGEVVEALAELESITAATAIQRVFAGIALAAIAREPKVTATARAQAESLRESILAPLGTARAASAG